MRNISIKRQFKKWLVESVNEDFSERMFRNRLECRDGFSMSVQGSKVTYSTPRENCFEFTEMEVGFPSEYEELIAEYSEGYDYTETVYPYVPVKLILKVIRKHGGIK